MKVTIVGDLMWYLEKSTSDLPARNRTTLLSFESAILAGSAVNLALQLASAGHFPKLVSLVSAGERAKTTKVLQNRLSDLSGLVDHDGFANILIAFADEESARSVFVGHSASPATYRRLQCQLRGNPVCVYGGSRDRIFRVAVLRYAQRRHRDIFCFAPSYSIFAHSRHELADFAQAADLTILNRDEFGYFSRMLGGPQRAIGMTRTCIVTLASGGNLVFVRGRRVRVASKSRSQADVIGAGDVFLAAFLESWLGSARHDPVVASHAAATAAARYVQARVPR